MNFRSRKIVHNNLKNQTTSGIFWSLIDLLGNQGIQFLIQVILSRLLLPKDFGIMGIIFVFLALSNSIIDSGFSQALIRKKNVNQEDYSTIFYFNLLMSVVMFIVLYISAEPISKFFSQTLLVPIIRVLSFVLIINSFGIIQRVILTKNIDFRQQMKINLIAGLVSGIIAVIFAVLGFGVWSLIIRTLTMQFIQTLLLWVFNKWQPTFVFNINSFKTLFGFGSKLLISGLIDTFYNNIYSVIIGKFFSASQLGYYTNAQKLRDITSQSITSSVQRVTYPVLSSIQENEDQLKNGYRKVIKTSAFIIFPIMLGLAAIANPLIDLLFSAKWHQSVLYLQLLCLAGMLYPIHAINLNILQVKGRSDLFLLLELIKKVLLTTLLACSLWFDMGIVGLIVVAVLHSFISLFVNTYYSSREISYSTKTQLMDLAPIFIISCLMWGIVYYIGRGLDVSNLLKIAIQVVVGILFYVLASRLAKVQELDTVFGLFITYFKRLKLKRRLD
jgi:O-antigen/teichoic acid export membrane protein